MTEKLGKQQVTNNMKRTVIVILLVSLTVIGIASAASDGGLFSGLFNVLFGHTTATVGAGLGGAIVKPIQIDIGDGIKIDQNTTVNIVYDGTTPIKDALAANVQSSLKKGGGGKSLQATLTKSNAVTLNAATDTIMKTEPYPYSVSNPTLSSTGETLTIVNYRCDDNLNACGYWITATRNGKEIATHSPIWVVNPPVDIVESRSMDTGANVLTVTMKEDPKKAIENVLTQYINGQSLGKGTIGTKV